MRESITLYELNSLVREVLETSLEEEYWVQGELSEGRVGYGGHFYGELIQKDERTDKIVAKARVTCWGNHYNLLALRFNHETGETLKAGMKVLLLVHVSFHEQFGYSLNILDIDASFSLGNMMQRRMAILHQLEKDGTINDNKDIPMPMLTQRIAIISSASAAGYGDFCNQLKNNEYGFYFQWQLFPAIMQGTHVEESIISALQQIADESEQWDVAVIIRGGGATSDLSDFDSYPLASCITQFPIPVITGIGHDRDETVLDHVAHTHLKTPTAVADFLINTLCTTAARLDELTQRLTTGIQLEVEKKKQTLEQLAVKIPLTFGNIRTREEYKISTIWERLRNAATLRKEKELHKLQLTEQKISALDPYSLLKRGYSVTLHEGKIVRDIQALKPGDQITTKLEQGEILSIIRQCKKN